MGAEAGTEVDRVDESNGVLSPMFAFLEEVLALGIDCPAGGNDRKVGGIEESNCDEFVGAGWFVGPHHFSENELDAFFGDSAAEAHAADNRAEGVSDNFGAIAEVSFRGLLDANVFLDLPGADERPDACEQGVNEDAASSHSIGKRVIYSTGERWPRPRVA